MLPWEKELFSHSNSQVFSVSKIPRFNYTQSLRFYLHFYYAQRRTRLLIIVRQLCRLSNFAIADYFNETFAHVLDSLSSLAIEDASHCSLIAKLPFPARYFNGVTVSSPCEKYSLDFPGRKFSVFTFLYLMIYHITHTWVSLNRYKYLAIEYGGERKGE